jgi:DNA-directed RNA polymerase specialized sigma subunit
MSDDSHKIDLILSVGESFISNTGKKFVKGEVYSVFKDEANNLLSVKGDFDIRFFKKAEGSGKKAEAQDVDTIDMHPTVQAIAESMNSEKQEVFEAAKAMDKADAVSSATRGQGDEAIEQQLEQKQRISTAGSVATGELDTATDTKPRGRGRPATGVPV